MNSSRPSAVSAGASGIASAAAAPSSSPFINPYSLRSAVDGATSSSDSDSFTSPLPSLKKAPQTASVKSSLKLPAVQALHVQGNVGGGPLLSGYDSWSEDDADAGGGGSADDDDWSDTETPQEPVSQVLKSKPTCAAKRTPDTEASPGGSASDRVDAWAARFAGGGLLGLMLHMRRCRLSKAVCGTCASCSHIASEQCVGRASAGS